MNFAVHAKWVQYVAGLLLLVSCNIPVSADALTSSVERALVSLDKAKQDENWRFTINMVVDSEARIILHDPTKALSLQRTLLEVNGAPPDEDQLSDFRKQEKKRIDDRDPQAGYAKLVDVETLQLADETDEFATLIFSPRVHQLEASRDRLEGSLVLHKSSEQIEKIEIFNTENFSPVFSVKIEEFRLTFTFRDEQGARLLTAMRSHTRGKAGFLKSFESLVTARFTDFQRNEPSPESASAALPK